MLQKAVTIVTVVSMTQRVFLTFMLAAALGLGFGCGDSEGEGVRTVDAASEPIKAAVRSNESVARKLAQALRDQSGNLFYSPISIEAAAAMLLAGAAGNTATQLGELLDAEVDPTALHRGLAALLADLGRKHATYTLSLANRIWTQAGLKPSQAFVAITRDIYGAPMQTADFAAVANRVRKDINSWVADRTSDKIPQLFEEGQINASTVMALANAIYFKAEWDEAFDPKLTRTGMFTRADSSTVAVQMMSTPEATRRTSYDDGAFWVELPYRGGDISFLLYTLMPDSGEIASVEALQESLDGVDIRQVVDGLHPSIKVIVQLPRLSMRSRIDLVPVFQALGVTDVFDPEHADLSHIGRGLYVDPLVHEAMVEVDEAGTVAAAATGAAVLLSSPEKVRFDHPFVFFIRDNLTGAILFSGQVADPSAG